jgi:hypothetical protein
MTNFELHHRWYPKFDTMKCLMAVHRNCHNAIHFGGKIKAGIESLAAKGDTGKGMTRQWKTYLDEN